MKIKFFLILSLLLVSIYIHYRVNKSFIEQTILLFEFNSYQQTLPLDIVNEFNTDFPNITTTALPLKMMKARYFMRDSLVEDAIQLLKKSQDDNPNLGISDYEIGKYLYNEKKYDSAYLYLKKAAGKLPRNDMFSRLYFLDLAKLKKEKELDSAFMEIKNFYIIDQWKDYLFTKLEVNPESKQDLFSLLEEAKKNIANGNQLRTLESILTVGYENLNELSQIVTQAEVMYEREFFNESATLHLLASNLDPSEYVHYENAALSYYRGNNFDEAERFFRYVLSNFSTSLNGKSEFYLGMLLYEKKKKEEACKFWNISLKKGFDTSKRLIDTFCLE